MESLDLLSSFRPEARGLRRTPELRKGQKTNRYVFVYREGRQVSGGGGQDHRLPPQFCFDGRPWILSAPAHAFGQSIPATVAEYRARSGPFKGFVLPQEDVLKTMAEGSGVVRVVHFQLCWRPAAHGGYFHCAGKRRV